MELFYVMLGIGLAASTVEGIYYMETREHFTPMEKIIAYPVGIGVTFAIKYAWLVAIGFAMSLLGFHL